MITTNEYIAGETLRIEEGYSLQYWVFIWNGETIGVEINKGTKEVRASFEDTMPAEELFFIKEFVNKKLEEMYGEPDDSESGD